MDPQTAVSPPDFAGPRSSLLPLLQENSDCPAAQGGLPAVPAWQQLGDGTMTCLSLRLPVCEPVLSHPKVGEMFLSSHKQRQHSVRCHQIQSLELRRAQN